MRKTRTLLCLLLAAALSLAGAAGFAEQTTAADDRPHQHLLDALDGFARTYASMEAALADAQARLLTNETTIREQGERLAALEAEREKLTDELAALTEQSAARLDEADKAAAERIGALEAAMAEKDARIEALEQENAALQAQLTQSGEEARTLTEANAALQAQLAQSGEEARTLTETNAALEEDLADKVAQIKAKDAAILSADKSAEAAKKVLEEKEAEIARLREACDKAKAEIERLNALLAEKEMEIGTLSEELDALREIPLAVVSPEDETPIADPGLTEPVAKEPTEPSAD